ncbi:MAG: hypothetical protein ACE5HL_11020 [Terriglobia bacterium]
MRGLTSAVLLSVLAAGTLAAAENFWTRKPPAEWTQEEALELLNDSPWTQRVRLYQVTGRLLAQLPDGHKVIYRTAPNLPPRRYTVEPVSIEPELAPALYAVRWSSAAILQQALGRLQGIAPVLREMQAPPPELSPGHYVVTVRVVEPPQESRIESHSRPLLQDETGRPVRELPPQVADVFAGLDAEGLRARAELRIGRRRRLKPERVLRHGLGASEGVSFFFPRQENGRTTLPADTKWAEFVFVGEKGDKLKAKFKFKEMRVAGRPDY